MIETLGLTHISLSVKDLNASLAFYHKLFGVTVLFQDDRQIQVQTPGANDVIAFERRDTAGARGGVDHFGFRLKDPAHIEKALEVAKEAGADIVRTGTFAPGCPYLYIRDPDGYMIEIWYE